MIPMRRTVWTWAILALCSSAIAAATPGPQSVAAGETFAARVATLSEPGGYFDTDDLISNERSYLHVAPALRHAGLAGTAYIGVGPDTNFSYIAETRPSIAFIIDIRRDNLLLHLLFKALFAESATRIDFLARLIGRTAPADLEAWRHADIGPIVAALDRVSLADAAATRARHGAIESRLKTFGVPLSPTDLETIDRFHRTFESEGLDLKLEIIGRGSPAFYPTFRDLLLERDRDGRQASYCASEDDFQFVRALEARDLVIPVVGDLGGTTALRNIGRLMTARGEVLGAFYTSNVEFYLFRSGTFQQFVGSLSHLPHSERSVIIRSAFISAVGGTVPMLPGYGSASLLGGVDDLVQGVATGRIRGYLDLVAR
jgi:hypothetical protein